MEVNLGVEVNLEVEMNRELWRVLCQQVEN